MSNPKFIKWVVQIALRSLGIFNNRLYSIICCSIFTFSISLGVFGSVVGFLNSTGTIDRLQSLSAISPQLSTLLVLLSLNTSHTNLQDLLSKVQDQDGNVIYTVDRTNASIKSKLTRLAIIMVSQAFCFTIPVWIFSLQQDTIDEKYSFIVPYWFSCGNQSSRNVLQSLCWRIKNKTMLFAMNTLQMGGVIILNVVYFAAFSLYMTIVEELVKHLGSIRCGLSDLSKRIYGLSLKTQHRLDENEIHQDLLFIYNHQQFLSRFILDTISTWNRFIAIFFINFGINTVLFIIVIFHEFNDNTLLAVKMALLGLTLFAMAFIVANYAQQISHMKEDIFYELSNVPWYQMNVKFRKIYLSMLTLNCTLVPVKIADMYEVNMYSFGNMVKATYSICNILLLKFVK